MMVNFEQKIEPLSRCDVMMAGVTLQLFLIFFFVLSWGTTPGECFLDAMESNVSNDGDMLKFHDCITKYRVRFEIGSVCLLISFPFIILHLYYEHRISQTVGSVINCGLADWLYSISWIISATIYCTVWPALCIFVSYYDWEFSNNDDDESSKYIGYKIQFQFFHLLMILWDSCVIPIGIAASVPWFRCFAVLNGFGKSSYYSISSDSKEKLLGMVLKLKCGRILLSVFFLSVGLSCLFGAFADTFDFAKDGFWSFDGNSQFLQIITYMAIEFQCILYFGMVCKCDEKIKFISQNVKPVQKLEMASQDGVIQAHNLYHHEQQQELQIAEQV